VRVLKNNATGNIEEIESFFANYKDINQSLRADVMTVLLDDNKKPENVLDRYLEQRHLLDVVQHIPSSVSIPEFFKHLRPLVPRYYSISKAWDPNKISITIHVQHYSLSNKPRFGVTGKYLSSLKIGSQVGIFVIENTNFRLPKDNSTPLVMVGAGTGIAPMISFLQERVKAGATNNSLFFGCKYPDADYLYKDYLEDLLKNNRLKIFNAFSRQTNEKVYVQHIFKKKCEICLLFNWGWSTNLCLWQ